MAQAPRPTAAPRPARPWHGQVDRPWLAQMAATPDDVPPGRWDALAKELAQMLPPGQVLGDQVSRLAYSYDATGERRPPHLVVVPTRAADVGAVLAAAARARVPVMARGAGTNLSGGTLPLFGGVVLALQRLTECLEIDGEHLQARVGVGWVNAALQGELALRRLFYPPDPSSHRISTIGGNVQENSGGPHALRYGVTESHVLAVRGFLADGSPVQLTRPRVPGDWDLLGAVIGSEGTLLVATEATLNVRPTPAGTTTALLAFRSVAAACQAVARVVAARLDPAALELLDRPSIELVERFAAAGYPTEAGAVLLIDLDGSASDRAAALQALDTATRGDARLTFQTADSPAAAERLWLGRRSAYGALAQVSARVFVQDVTVPRPQLAAMMEDVLAIAQRWHLTVLTVAHAGDGNLHPTMAYDPSDPDEMARLARADAEILAAAAHRDGSITGEHGVGIDKLEHLPLMYGRSELEAMLEVKRAFDPQLALNPGKAIWTAPALGAVPERPPGLGPEQAWRDEARDVLRQARDARTRVQIVGKATRAAWDGASLLLSTANWTGIPALDVDNLTATVASGLTFRELDSLVAPHGLEWAVDPLTPDETVGGLVAGALPAWREAGPGPVRQQVLGVEAIDGAGRTLRFGRPVLKNVAGYDLTKLFVGSFGRLGVLTAVTVRLRPRQPLVWRGLAVDPPGLAAAAWASLARPERPEAVVARPGRLLTAWAADPGARWGPTLDDPRGVLGSLLADRLRHGGRFHPLGRADAPPGPEGWDLWWPLAGVWLEPGSGGSPADGPSDPVAERLAQRIRGVFDPDHLWRGGLP